MSTDPDRSIETLIRLAGERELPSPEAVARARAAAEQSWRRSLQQSRRTRLRLPLAVAATLALAVAGWYGWNPRALPQPPVVVARVVTVDGAARMARGRALELARPDSAVLSGDILQSGQGRAAVTIGNALSLRLDRGTRLRFEAPEQVTLLEGSLYVDSGGLGLGPPLVIRTPAGDVRHIGTQFQVRVAGGTTGIRVREGRVALRSGTTGARTVAAGDALEVRGGEEHWQHGLPSFGAEWEWSATLAPALTIEDRPMAEFLAWMSREHGWQLHFGDESLQRRAQEIHLHGSLDGLDAAAMLGRVALVTGVPLTLDEGVLWVGTR
jgi:ferric-dicitrate binding protein FerR (iron transport regulator)